MPRSFSSLSSIHKTFTFRPTYSGALSVGGTLQPGGEGGWAPGKETEGMAAGGGSDELGTGGSGMFGATRRALFTASTRSGFREFYLRASIVSPRSLQ